MAKANHELRIKKKPNRGCYGTLVVPRKIPNHKERAESWQLFANAFFMSKSLGLEQMMSLGVSFSKERGVEQSSEVAACVALMK